MNLKLSNISMRSKNTTLFQAATEFKVDKELANILLLAIYKEIGLLTGNIREEIEISNTDPNLPKVLSIDSLEQTVYEHEKVLQRMIDAEFVKLSDQNIIITQSFVTVLKRAAEIQLQMHQQTTWQYIVN